MIARLRFEVFGIRVEPSCAKGGCPPASPTTGQRELIAATNYRCIMPVEESASHRGIRKIMTSAEGQEPRLPLVISAGGKFLKDSFIRGFWPVSPVQRQGHTARAVGRGPDPGVLVGESPGLNRRTARSLEARADDATIDLGLTGKVVFVDQLLFWI